MSDKLLTSNTDLEEFCNYFHINLIACVRKKDLHDLERRKNGAYIINLDDNGKGSHWTCFYIHKNQVTYYDSFAGPMPDDVALFCQGISLQSINYDVIQNLENDVLCGYYCVAFLYDCQQYKEKRLLEDILIDHTGIFDLIYTQRNIKILQQMFLKMIHEVNKANKVKKVNKKISKPL